MAITSNTFFEKNCHVYVFVDLPGFHCNILTAKCAYIQNVGQYARFEKVLVYELNSVTDDIYTCLCVLLVTSIIFTCRNYYGHTCYTVTTQNRMLYCAILTLPQLCVPFFLYVRLEGIINTSKASARVAREATCLYLICIFLNF